MGAIYGDVGMNKKLEKIRDERAHNGYYDLTGAEIFKDGANWMYKELNPLIEACKESYRDLMEEPVMSAKEMEDQLTRISLLLHKTIKKQDFIDD